jgi:uroporphyrinogen III methyltransferase/synthase
MARAALALEGTVYLVGWGPGDGTGSCEKARALAFSAGVLLVDFPAPPGLPDDDRSDLQIVRGSADELREIALQQASRGRAVVRLYRGDPFLEESGLADAGLSLPRIMADAVSAGVPLSWAPPVGPLVLAGEDDSLPAPSYAGGSILVKGAAKAARGLMERGWRSDTAALLILGGGTAAQRVIPGRLGDLAGGSEEASAMGAAILVAGAAAEEDRRLEWLARRPLHDRGIVVTRPRAQAALMVDLLESAGARVIEFPTIAIQAVTESPELDQAVEDLGGNDWVIFTSVNGVELFFRRMEERGKDARAFGPARVAAIGPATAGALRRRGIQPDAVPARYQAEGLLDALGKDGLQGRSVLIPRAEMARDLLPDRLRELGARVNVAVTYRTVRPEADVDRLRRLLEDGRVDAVTFTSSSTVRNFTALFDPEEATRRLGAAGVVVACIGPITAGTAREIGYTVDLQAEEFTVPRLAAALARHFASRPD